MNCFKCKREIPPQSNYYLNVQYKVAMRICFSCYLVVTRGEGGCGWHRIPVEENGETNPRNEAIILLKNVIQELDSFDSSL